MLLFKIERNFSPVLGWRNWQTRMVEVHMEQSLGVQVPPRVPFFLFNFQQCSDMPSWLSR